MRLYALTGAVALDDPEFGHLEADEQGGFAMPGPLSDRLHRFHVNGAPLWESDAERHLRGVAEDRAHAQDPAVMLGLMQRLVQLAEVERPPASPDAPPAEQPGVEAPPVASSTRKRPAGKPS
jgi:hypothetical protein